MNQELKTAGFDGMTVVSFESRLSDVMGESILRYGGVPILAPSMQEIPLDRNPEAFAFADRLFAGDVDVIIFMTGVGVRMLVKTLETRSSRQDLAAALSRITTLARGPKPVQALRELGVIPSLTVPEPNTWREILETLDTSFRGVSLEGKTVAVQEYGVSSEPLIAGLKKRGAAVLLVPVYRWALPDDTRPLEEALEALIQGRVQLAFFTSAMQIRHVLKLASAKGLENSLRKSFRDVVVASVGPTCSETLRECGLSVDFEPTHPKMGHLVAEAARLSAELVRQKKQGITEFRLEERSRDVELEARRRRLESPFLKACRREKVPYTPVWLMRQAGRYMKEYRRLRERVSFLEFCKNKEFCAQAAIEAQQILNTDAAILFSDILLITEPLGFGLSYGAGEGPVISGDTQGSAWIDRIPEVDPRDSLGYVMDAVRLTRRCLKTEIPLIGFSGAPFTTAAYILEGGGSRHFLETKKFMFRDPAAWHALMEKITRALARYLNAQIEAGADCLQIFDSWVGCLSPEDFRRFVLPHSRALVKEVSGKGVPVIHFGTGTGSFLELFAQAGADVVGVDFHIELAEAWKRIGYDLAIQGNLDPALLLATPEAFKEQALRILDQAAGRPGHIFNVGHGILPVTPVDHVRLLVDTVHSFQIP